MRQRSSILEGLELIRRRAPGLTLAQIVVFLYIADEDEAIPMPDLQPRADMTGVQAWRNVQALADEGLVQVGRWKMGAITAVELTAAGQALAAELDQIVRRATPVQPVAALV